MMEIVDILFFLSRKGELDGFVFFPLFSVYENDLEI